MDEIEDFDLSWELVDLTEPITKTAVNAAESMSMDFHAFMTMALEEKLCRMGIEIQYDA